MTRRSKPRIPQGLKPASLLAPGGTAEVVPYPNVYAIASSISSIRFSSSKMQVSLAWSSLFDQRGQSKKLADPGVHNLATAGEQSLANNLIFEGQIQLLIFDQMSQERGDVAGVHHARVIRHAAGQVDRSDNGHTMLDHGLAGFGDLAVAATFGGQIEDHRTGRHSLHHVFGYKDRRFFSRNHRRGDHHIAFLHYFAQQLALTAVEVFILRTGISASVLRVFRLDGKLDKASAEALHLLLRGGP